MLKIELKEKYEKALEKWEKILELINVGRVFDARCCYFNYCSFCRDASNKNFLKETIDDPHIYFDIEKCAYNCGINKTICGGNNSLLIQLDEKRDGGTLKDEKKVIYKIIKSINKELKIINKTNRNIKTGENN